MRKKTIKFYFFNNFWRNPGINYLFCFSKRAFKQNRQKLQAKKFGIGSFSKKKRIDFINTSKHFKYLLNNKIKLNQWHANCTLLHAQFLKSFFSTFFDHNKYKNRPRTNKKKIKIRLWFLFKNKFNKTMFKFLQRYSSLGVLSSHFVHILSRKNLTYQVWSKYKSKTFNMFTYNTWMYNQTKYTTMCNQILLNMLYFYTSNPSLQSIHYDDNFNIQTTNYTKITKNSLNTHKNMYIINDIHTSNNLNMNTKIEDLYILYKYWGLIEKFLNEIDKQKKEQIQNELNTLGVNNQQIIFYHFFVFYKNYKNYKQVEQQILTHLFLYKKTNLNNIDISSRIP